MTQNQMCNFFKKACISSIKNFPASNAPKPLNKIWLLGKFYLIHFYPLKFIDNDRGISLRAVKQFEALTGPQFLNTLCKKSINEIIKKNSIRWGTKGIRSDEVIATLINPRELEDYKQRVLTSKESHRHVHRCRSK
ncbi:MAG: hypothetical protein MJZ10_07175 [Fibrobacter sp.]|nr:hypothetical protein [Fibrobacter sp.]